MSEDHEYERQRAAEDVGQLDVRRGDALEIERGHRAAMIPGLSQVTTAFDPSMAPEGHDTWWFWSGLVPSHPNEDWDVVRDRITERVLEDCGHYYDGLESLEIARRPLTPYDLEQRFGAPEGNVYHVDPIITRFGPMRPALGLGGYDSRSRVCS